MTVGASIDLQRKKNQPIVAKQARLADLSPVFLKRNGNFVLHLARLRVGSLHQAVRPRGVQRLAVNPKAKSAAAALVPPRPPHGIDMTLPIAQGCVRRSITFIVTLFHGQSEGLDVTCRKTDGHHGFLGMEGLAEQIRRER